jgi:hypothetical protein
MKAVPFFPNDIFARTRLRLAVAWLIATTALGSCSPIAPSLFKDSSLRGPTAPLAGLGPAVDAANDMQTNTGEEVPESQPGPTPIPVPSNKGVLYITTVELGSEDGECSEQSCPLPAPSTEPQDRSTLTITLGAALLRELLHRGETRFLAPLDFIPTRITTRLRLRSEEDASAGLRMSQRETESLDWDEIEIHLEPLIVADSTVTHWLAKIPGTTSESLLAALRTRLESVVVEFHGAEETDAIPAPVPYGVEASADLRTQGELTPAAAAPKADLTALKDPITDSASVR